ncbi:YceI family protein [Mucilaginibacter sp. UR6-11]|uniref:YceI family protein n=1 Tax=Mucilaginibacter sp. UR6-11 TaxID=1435644 RepID=UPI001E311168|nr:YceI family protein [Mucilaginibacter sp. UR6-11]MCC8423828.1 YceI family protein [Mucilaginibacter sp. UR6-11]
MKKIVFLFAAALLSVTAVSAQTTWKVDKAHAQLKFTITHLAVSDVEGVFKDFDVSIVTNKPDFSDAKFNLVVQTASVNTLVEKRDEDLRSANFFDVDKFATMTFTSTGITKTTPNHYQLKGNLTLHGITKPVVMNLWYRGTITNPMSNAADAGFQLTGVIKRSDFNFGSKYSAPILSDEVQITANGEFGKAN